MTHFILSIENAAEFAYITIIVHLYIVKTNVTKT